MPIAPKVRERRERRERKQLIRRSKIELGLLNKPGGRHEVVLIRVAEALGVTIPPTMEEQYDMLRQYLDRVKQEKKAIRLDRTRMLRSQRSDEGSNPSWPANSR